MDAIPRRILRFRLRLMRHSFTIRHVAGKYLYTAYVLSRSPSPAKSDDCKADELETSAELFISTAVSHPPATRNRFKKHSVLHSLKTNPYNKLRYTVKKSCQIDQELRTNYVKPFWLVRTEFSVNNDLLLRGSRIVIPELLQQEALGQLHEGHQGIVKSQNRAKISVW